MSVQEEAETDGMGSLVVEGVELDSRACDVLEAVYVEGGETSTSEVKAYTGLDHSQVVLYRFEKLEDAGLVETWEGEWERAVPAPTRVGLTERGREVAAGMDGVTGGGVMSRVERLERLVEGLQREVVRLEGELAEGREGDGDE